MLTDALMKRQQAGQVVTALFSKATRQVTYVLAPALVPEVDTQNDFVSVEEIAQAAKAFASGIGGAGHISLMHKKLLAKTDVKIVESYILQSEQRFGDVVLPQGSWLLGLHIYSKELQQAVIDKIIRGLSIGGRGERVLETAA